MNVHIITPYALDLNLGKAYNQAMAMIPDDDWACLMDYDAMFLTPDAGKIIHEYARLNPNAGLLTACTNRVHPLSKQQLLNGSVSPQPNIIVHMKLAELQKRHLYRTAEIRRAISGFLILISKRQWMEMKFTEDLKCLGVDTEYSHRLQVEGKPMLLMCGLYVWHTYRLLNGITQKNHLL